MADSVPNPFHSYDNEADDRFDPLDADDGGIPLDRCEVRLLAQYWIDQIVGIDAEWYFLRVSSGSSCIQRKNYANSRLESLVASGRISLEEIKALHLDAEKLRGIDWDNEVHMDQES